MRALVVEEDCLEAGAVPVEEELVALGIVIPKTEKYL